MTYASSASVEQARATLADRAAAPAPMGEPTQSLARQKLIDAFAACALCVGGSLALHVASCLVGVPAASLAVTGVVNAFAGMSTAVGMVSSPLVALGAFAYWYRRRGRWSTEQRITWRGHQRSIKPLVIWNACAAVATAMTLNPLTPTGQWIDQNVVGLVHAEFWYLTQPASAQKQIQEIARSLNMGPARYALERGLCTTPAPR